MASGAPRGNTYVGSGHLFRFKTLNFIILGGLQKNEYFWGYEDLWIFLGVRHKIGPYLEVISMQFRVFS